MADHFFSKLSLLGRYFLIPLLVIAVGLLGPAAAAQMVCPADCDMHTPVPVLPSCCENPKMEHEAMGTAEHSPLSSPSPEPCCEGKLCIDSSAALPELTIALSNVECDISAPASLCGQAPPIQSFSPVKFSSKLDIKGPPIPVYIRTCVFLI